MVKVRQFIVSLATEREGRNHQNIASAWGPRAVTSSPHLKGMASLIAVNLVLAVIANKVIKIIDELPQPHPALPQRPWIQGLIKLVTGGGILVGGNLLLHHFTDSTPNRLTWIISLTSLATIYYFKAHGRGRSNDVGEFGESGEGLPPISHSPSPGSGIDLAHDQHRGINPLASTTINSPLLRGLAAKEVNKPFT
jgi:hypothetical protein